MKRIDPGIPVSMTGRNACPTRLVTGCALAAAAFVVAVVLLLLAKLFLPDNPIVAVLNWEDGVAAVESWLTGSRQLFDWRVWRSDHPELLWTGVLLLVAAMLAGVVGFLRRRRHLHRRLTRLRSGLCPACGYDRRAQQPDDPCPECGLRRARSSRTPPAK